MYQTGQQKLNEAFYQNEAGEWVLRTSGGSGSSSGGGAFAPPADTKSVSKTRVGLVDTFNFYSDLAQTTLVKTIVITYASESREEFTAEETFP